LLKSTRATLRAKGVRMSRMFHLCGGFLRVDNHSANRVSLHDFPYLALA
jgi:hypothetical protein